VAAPESRLLRIYRAANALQAHMLKGLLEQQGIAARVVGEGLSSGAGELPADVVQVDILVAAANESAARQIVKSFEADLRSEKPRDDWFCQQCGERNPGQFEVCWQCQAPS
jgi:hypothetical protein